MQVEKGIAVGDKDDRCVYKNCPKNGIVKAGDYMAEVGIVGYRFHNSCWNRIRREMRVR